MAKPVKLAQQPADTATVGVFLWRGRSNWPLVLLYLGINLIVAYNALFHDPAIGYDTSAYLDYIVALSEGRLPTSEDTGEYFSPPLAFIPGAAAYAALQPFADLEILNPPVEGHRLSNFLYYRLLYSIDDFPLALAAKGMQFLNLAYSFVITYVLLKICDMVRPGDPRLKLLTLLLVLMLPVYFKTMAFVRAEPLLLTLVILAFYYLFKMQEAVHFRPKDALILGILAGLGLLTRQWFAAALLVLPIALLWLARSKGVTITHIGGLLVIYTLTAMIISLPFYIHLDRSEGSPFAFNLEHALPTRAIWADYIDLDPRALFVDPLRSSLEYQILPILYTETWGDYWGYFVFFAREKATGRYLPGLFAANDIITAQEVANGTLQFETNRFEVNTYLGRVNALALFPALGLLAGLGLGLGQLLALIAGKAKSLGSIVMGLATLFILAALAIYLGFVLLYAQSDPSTIKATYILYIFPFLAVLAAEMLTRWLEKRPTLFWAGTGVLLLICLHNLPAALTRHIL